MPETDVAGHAGARIPGGRVPRCAPSCRQPSDADLPDSRRRRPRPSVHLRSAERARAVTRHEPASARRRAALWRDFVRERLARSNARTFGAVTSAMSASVS